MTKNNHNVLDIHFHLVVSTKRRAKVLTKQNSKIIEQCFKTVANKYSCNLVEFNIDVHEGKEDHVHILFEQQQLSDIQKMINAFKTFSSKAMKQTVPDFKWAVGFYLGAVSNQNLQTVRDYVKDQHKDEQTVTDEENKTA